MDTSFEHYLAQKKLAPNTRTLYASSLARFGEWCRIEEIDPPYATTAEILRFLEDLQAANGLKRSTLANPFKTCKGYFRWLEDSNVLTRSPMRGLTFEKVPPGEPKSVPIDDLRTILDVTKERKSWAIIAILTFGSLVPAELAACDVSNLESRGGTTLLHFSPHRMKSRPPVTVLIPEVAEAVAEQLEGRRHGPLFQNAAGKRIDKGFVQNILRTACRRADLDYRITPQMLTYTLPTVAMQEGFSLVGVLRAAGVFQPRHADRWLPLLGEPTEQNASVRLARLVLDPPEAPENWLLHTEAILAETDLPEAFAVMGAGAVLERHVRELCIANGIHVPPQDKNTGSLNKYADELLRAGLITLAEKDGLGRLGKLRNDADHGWFERLPADSALSMVREVREFCARHPL